MKFKGYCPTQNKIYEIEATLFERENKKVLRVDCEYHKVNHDCKCSKCPIIEENGYHQ